MDNNAEPKPGPQKRESSRSGAFAGIGCIVGMGIMRLYSENFLLAGVGGAVGATVGALIGHLMGGEEEKNQ